MCICICMYIYIYVYKVYIHILVYLYGSIYTHVRMMLWRLVRFHAERMMGLIGMPHFIEFNDWRRLQETPLFDGKKTWFPVDLPFNQSIEHWVYHFVLQKSAGWSAANCADFGLRAAEESSCDFQHRWGWQRTRSQSDVRQLGMTGGPANFEAWKCMKYPQGMYGNDVTVVWNVAPKETFRLVRTGWHFPTLQRSLYKFLRHVGPISPNSCIYLDLQHFFCSKHVRCNP